MYKIPAKKKPRAYNILLAYECLHTIKNKKSRVGYCAVELDMHKAYDRVEWILFLEKMMLKLSFHREICGALVGMCKVY